MKKIIFTAVLFLMGLFILSENCTAQWQSDVRLNNDPSASNTSYNNGRSIACKGDTVIVVWMTQVNTWWSIYSKRSYNGGVSWFDSVEVRQNPLIHYTSPSVCYSNNRFYIANAGHNTNLNVWYLESNFSTDFGVTWDSRSVFTSDSYIKDKPSIVADSNYVHVVCWFYISPSSIVTKYKRSTNFGLSFADESAWSTISTTPDNPSITCSGSNVMVAYQESSTGKYDIVYYRSTNYGLGWGGYQTIATGSDNRGFPSIASSGSYVLIFWQDSKYGNSDILCRRSTNTGTSWIGEVRLTSHSSNQYRPNVYASGTMIHAVWEDDRDSTEIYYLRSTNNGGSWQSVQQLTDNPYSSLKPSVIASGSKVHVCWTDRRTGNYDTYYKRNPTGNTIGIQKISSEIPEKYSLSQNYPNPFNPITKIKFDIAANSSGQIFLSVYNILGEEIATLVNGQLNPGTYEVTFSGSGFSSGIYYYRLLTEEFSETRKMLIIK